MIARTSEQDVNIPVVDLSSPNAPQELLDAAVTYGFIFVKHTDDTPIRDQDLESVFDISRDFFASPLEVKSTTPIKDDRGYVCMNREALDPKKHKNGDFKEYV